MRLAQRLLLGLTAVILAQLVATVVMAGGRLEDHVSEQLRDELFRSARLIGSAWTATSDADSAADVAGAALGQRVTLIDASGRVVGDSEFDAEALGALENHATRPEVRAAMQGGTGTATRVSPSAGDEEMYAAVRHPNGVVRVSVGTGRLATVVDAAERDVVAAAVLAFLGAIVLAWLFARSVSRPIVELRDVAASIAAGDLRARPVLAGPGELGDLASALHEMAEQLARRLDALREEDALLTTLFESLNEGVLALSPRRTVVRINQRAREFLHLAEATPVPEDMLPRNATLRDAVEAALAGAVTEPTELVLHGRTLAVTARPLAAGGAVVALFDLTAIRRLELIRRDFVANVSHELKTPLTVVRGFAETLTDEGIPPAEHRRFAAAIAANATRMQRIVDDLLDLSRIESGRWTPNPEPVGLDGVVADVLTAVHAQIEARELAVDVELGTDTVVADPTALRQILANLVENAVRHTPAGGITIRVTQRSGHAELAVSDTGIGIAPEHLPRIFERFYRVDPARARAEGGTGLGLSIVKHLVEAHGGSVRATSEVGRGTTVIVTLPQTSR